MKPSAVIAVCLVGTLVPAMVGAPARTSNVDTDLLERVYYDAPDEQGRLSGGVILLPRPDLQTLLPGPLAEWTTIMDHGPSSNRLDIVFVGDGYLASELDLYAAHGTLWLTNLLSQKPCLIYST